jgi:hypothetical protein
VTSWLIHSADNMYNETIFFPGSPSIDPSDYTFV